MKRFIPFVLSLLFLATSALCGCGEVEEMEIEYAEGTLNFDYSELSGTEVKVYNWGNYISDGADGTIDVNEEFEKLTGIKVIYDNYDSNESLYAKLASGGADYDVVIPSDYMIGRLISEGYLEEINFSNIPNYEFIDQAYKNTQYDPENRYSVPYNVGKVGIIYNTYMVEGTPTSWSLMWDENYKGKILNFNNSRDAFAIAQFYNGIDINTTDKAELDKAFDSLVEQKQILQSYVMDEVFNKMESGEAAIAPYYAGDFFTMYGNNEDLAFYYPEEGTNVFIDAACVLKGAKNKKAAELYINFLMDPAIAQANAEYIYYASPNTEVIKNEDYLAFLEELHPDAYDILYGDVDNPKDDSFIDLPAETKSYMTEKWTQLGATSTEESGNDIVYGICIVLLALIMFWFAFSTVRKKTRERMYD
ncbi:MAG: spermidine/putrescine ABC transporter substrate-binding protein [Ruminococcaceae bacterium]|nr:spermidine/putrescine ABC transporter substrate-binding protein [Oscillospiraceae bacterium]